MARLWARALSGWHPLVLVPLALAAWVYHPITRVFFFADDFVHLAEIANENVLVFLLRPFGGQAFLGRNLVFLGSYQLFGVDPVPRQWIALLTHLLNVWLLFGVLRTLTASAALACFGAALWGMSPLAAGSLGWYAAFGHVLVGTTLLLVLRGVTLAAAAGGPIAPATAAAWYALLLVGSTCYGPGTGVALVFPATLVMLLPAAWWQRGVRLLFVSLPLATLALYFGLRHLYTLIGQLPMEEVFQQRAALSGFEKIPALFWRLLEYSAAGTLLGFFLPATYPTPATWIAVAALAAGVVVILWRGSWEARRAALGMLVLWAGVYFMIAAGRANLYSLFKFPPEAAATAGRYHYAGTIPIVLLFCLGLRQVGRLLERTVPPWLALTLGLGLLVYGRTQSAFRIDEHLRCHDYFLHTRREIADAIAAAPSGATVYLENGTTPPAVLGPAIPDRLFPGRAAVFLLSFPSAPLDRREVRFVERDPQVLAWYRDTERAGTPLGRLLVAPAEARDRP